MTRTQLTDKEWEFIGPFLPVGAFGPYPERLREQFEGVMWRFRPTGAAGSRPVRSRRAGSHSSGTRGFTEIAPGSRTVVADHPALLSGPACRR